MSCSGLQCPGVPVPSHTVLGTEAHPGNLESITCTGQLRRSFQYCWDMTGSLWAAPEALLESFELLPAVSRGPWGSLLAGFSRLWERRDLFPLCWVGKLLLGELLCHMGRDLSILGVAFDQF